MKPIEVCGDKVAGWVEFFETLTLGYDFQTLALGIRLDFTFHPWGWRGLTAEVHILFFSAVLSIGSMAPYEEAE